MKKHIIAAAVAAAVAVPAIAQNVQVYGLLDTGYSDIERKVAGSINAGKDAFVFNSHASSRFGIRGTEDLGGGMKASFVAETGISNNARDGLERNLWNVNGNAQGNGSTLDATVFGNRGLFANLDLGQGTSVRVGYGSTPIRDAILEYDAVEGSNNAGNTLVNDANFSSSRLTGVQLSHKFGAITVIGALYRNNDEDVAAGVDAKTSSGTLIAAKYAAGPFSFTAVNMRLDQQNAAATATSAANGAQDPISTTAGVTGVFGANVAAFDGTRQFTVIGGSYDLGVAKIYANYGSAKISNELGADLAGEGKYSSSMIGVSVPVGSYTLMGSVSDGKNKLVATANQAENRATSAYIFGVKQALSKRTAAYLVSGKTTLDAGTGAAATETIVRQTSLGLIHSF